MIAAVAPGPPPAPSPPSSTSPASPSRPASSLLLSLLQHAWRPSAKAHLHHLQARKFKWKTSCAEKEKSRAHSERMVESICDACNVRKEEKRRHRKGLRALRRGSLISKLAKFSPNAMQHAK
eukprot:987056-Pelagomonas_calceolata.AAC.2